MKKYFRALNDTSIPVARRILCLSSLGSLAGSIVVAVLLVLSAAKSTYIIIAAALAILTFLLTGLAFFSPKYSRNSIICTIVWNCLMFPFWFFCFYGTEGGVNLFFLLGLFLCFVLHKGAVRIWLFSISIIVDVAVLLLPYYKSELIIQPDGVVPLSASLISVIVTGFLTAFICILVGDQNERAVAERNELEQRVAQLSDFDPMTGIYGEKAFYGVLNSYFEQGLSYGVILFDVDYLAVINAKYGAEVGNRILQDIAAILKDVMESEQLVSKCTGGTFAMVIKEEDTEYLFDLAQAVRFRIEDELTLPEESETVTVSGGVYYSSEPALPRQVMNGAFENLQKAKKAGRNCVVAS